MAGQLLQEAGWEGLSEKGALKLSDEKVPAMEELEGDHSWPREVLVPRSYDGISLVCSGITRWVWFSTVAEGGRSPLAGSWGPRYGSWNLIWSELHYGKLTPWALETDHLGRWVGVSSAMLKLLLLSKWDDRRLSTELLGHPSQWQEAVGHAVGADRSSGVPQTQAWSPYLLCSLYTMRPWAIFFILGNLFPYLKNSDKKI